MRNKPSLFAIAALCALGFAGCENTLRQDMANQPRQNPLSPSEFFADGRSERQANRGRIHCHRASFLRTGVRSGRRWRTPWCTDRSRMIRC